MANFTALKTAINNAIKTNGNEEITGAILQAILDAMVETLGDSAINDLENAITTEVTNRENAVGGVADDLAAEVQARQALDYNVNNRINAEEYNRQNADAALNQTMSQGFQTLGSQMTALNAAISALNAAYQNGYLYGGIATPSSSPSNNKCFYIALQGGTYTNFGGVGVVEGINIIKNDSGWRVEHIYDQTTLLNEFYLLRQQVIRAISSIDPIVIQGDVTNAPDEEDLTSDAQHLLKFKDRAYSPLNFSGLGMKILRKNIAPLSDSAAFNGFVEGVTAEETLAGTPELIFWDRMNTRFIGIKDGIYYAAWTDDDNYVPVSTSLVYMYNGTPYQWTGSDFIVDETEVPNLVNCLTQDMINEANTIYIIRYDYTLKEDITIPANCVLQFDGGSLNGNNISGNGCLIIGEQRGTTLFDNVRYFNSQQVHDLNSRLPIKYLETNNFIFTITYHTESTHSNNGIGALQLYVSLNGLDFYNAGHVDIPNQIYRWDTSVCFLNNKLLIGNDTQNGKYEIAETTDLESFNNKLLDTPATWNQIWGGELYSEGEKLYFIGSVVLTNDVSKDKHLYIMELSTGDYSIVSTTEILLPVTDGTYRNYIDPFIIKIDNDYYLIIKDETTTINKVFKSDDLTFSSVVEVNSFLKLQEGLSSVIFKNKIYTYSDNFSWLNPRHDLLKYVGYGTLLQVSDTSFSTISTPIKVNVENNEYNRHSTYVVADTPEKRNIIVNYIKDNITNLSVNSDNDNNIYILGVHTEDGVESNEYNDLLLKPNSIYRVDNECVINSFDGSLLGIGDKAFIELPKLPYSFETLTIKNSGSILLPDTIDMVFNSYTYSPQILTIYKTYNNELVLQGSRNNKAYRDYVNSGVGLYEICSISLRVGRKGSFYFFTKDGENTFASAYVEFYKSINDVTVDCRYISLLVDDEMYYKIDGNTLHFYVYKPYTPLHEFYTEVSNNHNAYIKQTYISSTKDVSDKIKLEKTSAIMGGTTSKRPTNPILYSTYFDTSLTPARPIWYKGNNTWVDATGATV